MLRMIFIFLIAIAIQGCTAAYKIPKDADVGELSTIHGSYLAQRLDYKFIKIHEIDGQSTFPVFKLGPQNDYKRESRTKFQLLPGEHVFNVEYHTGSYLFGSGYSRFADITAVIEPGKDYEVRYRDRGEKLQIWIEERKIRRNVTTGVEFLSSSF